MRRRLTWLVALPAIVAGSQAAHALAYRLVFPEAPFRTHVLAVSGHGYLAWLPLTLGVAGAIAFVGLAAAAVDAARGRAAGELSPLGFALLPPLAFALQEIVELSVHTGTFDVRALAAPTFLPGLALQLPFALVAYLVARLLLRVAARIGRAFAAAPRLRVVPQRHRFRDPLAARSQPGCSIPRAPPLVVGI